ncbi:VTC domain-containing protein [Candidatus Pelagibacter ubique]|nr:VTC domain-containing protein [Candidatus Pelagibacter ubique]
MTFRFERKYPGHISKIFNYYSFANLNNFVKSYPSREVNSIYFDKNYILANQNLDGVSEKTKIRLRWYNSTSDPQLEFKIKKGFLNRKEIYKFNLLKDFNIDQLIDKCLVIMKNKQFFNFRPISYVSYEREYFQHLFYKDLRLTIDKKINFSSFNLVNITERENIVMELKYDPKIDNQIMNLLEFKQFNIKLQKYSKYIQSLIFIKKNII